MIGAGALQEGSWGATTHEAVAPQADEAVVTKRGVSAFYNSDLASILATANIGTLVLCGVATNFVVEATAREAADRGFRTIVVGDCCASMSPEVHEAALNTTLPMLTEITNLGEVVAALG